MAGRAPILIPNGKASYKIWDILIAANNIGSCISFITDVYLERAISALQERSYVFDQQLLVFLYLQSGNTST
jgi:hypothetical protein